MVCPVTKGCPTISATDPIAAEQHSGQRAGGGVREQPVEPLPAGPAGRAPRHRHQEGKHTSSPLTWLCLSSSPSTSLAGAEQVNEVWETRIFVSKLKAIIMVIQLPCVLDTGVP